MATQLDAFVAAMGAAVGWTPAQIEAVQAAADQFLPTTPTDLANIVTTFVNNAGLRDNSYNALFTGTATGGPDNDGDYPVQLFGGGTVLLPSPAALAQSIQRGADAQTGANFQVFGPFSAGELLGGYVSPTAQIINPAAVVGRCRVPPTATAIYPIFKNFTVQVGTLTWAAGALSGPTCALTDNALDQGDAWQLLAPATVDLTHRDFIIACTNGAS